MRKNKLFILLPSKSSSGPIKGAYAMANGLVKKYDISIYYLKEGKGVNSFLDPKIKEIQLSAKSFGLFGKILKYRKIIKIQKPFISFSICFSADFSNFFCGDLTRSISSIRGNLPLNYYYDYGLLGYLLAIFHLNILRKFDLVFSMSGSMKSQIKKLSGIETTVISNFIDEKPLEKYRKKKKVIENQFNIAFLGSLTKRKQPLLLLDIYKHINNKKMYLNYLGEGPLKNRLLRKIKKYNLVDNVFVYGFMKNPYEIISKCDLLILPSLSEGISRAMLEALFLGLSCIVFDVDSNSEIANQCSNLYVVKSKDHLISQIKEIMNKKSKNKKSIDSLNFLPDEYRQDFCIKKLIQNFNSLESNINI